MSIEAMKQALEALLDTNASGVPAAHNDSAIEALNQAIAEAEKQERNFCSRCGKRTNHIHTCTPPRDNT